MNQEQIDRSVRTLIEEFWEMESALGASDEAVKAAWNLQKLLGYVAPYDEDRLNRVNKCKVC